MVQRVIKHESGHTRGTYGTEGQNPSGTQHTGKTAKDSVAAGGQINPPQHQEQLDVAHIEGADFHERGASTEHLTALSGNFQSGISSKESVGEVSQKNPFGGLHVGSEGKSVEDLQNMLVKWMPSWKGKLAVDGSYGPQTREALEFFKKTYGLGKDGSSVDGKTAGALADVKSGKFWQKDGQTGKSPHSIQAGRADEYEKARKGGYPFDESSGKSGGLSAPEIQEIASSNPHKMVNYKGFEMEALTAKRYVQLEKDIAKAGYSAHMTCTTGGTHLDPAHGEGRAIDFVIKDGSGRYIDNTGKCTEISEDVAKICAKDGFNPYNEYTNTSTYKTGNHMHITAVQYPAKK